MGSCKFCGNNAGFLRKKHYDCDVKNQEGLHQAAVLINETLFNKDKITDLNLNLLKTSHYLSDEQIKQLLISCWEKALDKVLDDDVLSVEEEANLVEFLTHFNLTQADLNKNDSYNRLIKAAVLREVIDGKVPDRITVNGQRPFNLLKDENLIWFFPKTDYYEDKTVRQRAGSSSGFSFRVAKGVYFRTGGFTGETISRLERTLIDQGALGITNKHIYFAGSAKSFRIKLDKIIAFTPYKDGIGIQKDGVTAKPQTFVIGDGWFAYNLLMNLSQH